ncbi:hypothetical protein FOA52_013215 [Chlamydomonas sp. UWO 241]|nr:hypothetical protein FOA52_013215 [Chlamydomonas sp. UWO 241]
MVVTNYKRIRGTSHGAWRLAAMLLVTSVLEGRTGYVRAASSTTTLDFVASPARGELTASCGFYKVLYTVRCNGTADVYVTPRVACNPTVSISTNNCGPVLVAPNGTTPSLFDYTSVSCFNLTSGVCMHALTAPAWGEEDVCVVISNARGGSLLPLSCNVLITGTTAPSADSGGGLAWPVWQIVVVSIAGFIGLLIFILAIVLWLRYCWCWGEPTQVYPDPAAGQQLPTRFPDHMYDGRGPLGPLKHSPWGEAHMTIQGRTHGGRRHSEQAKTSAHEGCAARCATTGGGHQSRAARNQSCTIPSPTRTT